jgi:acyl phosphate:glycerol-3-phosphate acyltransferase
MFSFTDSDFLLFGIAIPMVLAYLLGSIPTAVWVSKAFWKQDIRTLGSMNAGSTNMYRVFGFKAGFPVQVFDIAKGWLAAALPLFSYLAIVDPVVPPDGFSSDVAALACGLAAVLGHVYTCFAGFKGGKGVNTILGMMLIVEPWGSLVGIGVFVLVLLTSRMVSLGSMLAVTSFPVFVATRAVLRGRFDDTDYLLLGLGLLLAAFVVYTHRGNIGRVVAGTERKVNVFKKRKSAGNVPQ